jgi:hypothetical protein
MKIRDQELLPLMENNLNIEMKNLRSYGRGYENKDIILVGVHGADDLKLNSIAIGQFLDTERSESEISKFCSIHKELINSPKSVFISAHSLGTWIVSSCEILNPNNKIEGIFFGSYFVNQKSPKSDFMATTSRYKKIFYDNDWFANGLLKMPELNNAIILTPITNPLSFVNGHSISLYDNDISMINQDIKRVIKAQKVKKEETQKLSTTLEIMNYNIKMLNPLIFQLLSSKRAEWIPRELARRHPNNEVIIFNELFDNDAEKIFDTEMRKLGYKSSHKVSEDFFGDNIKKAFSGKFDDMKIENGGVKIYSKYKIEKQEQTTYEDSSKEDALAGKGAVSIRIRKNGIPIHIIGTHLQSGRKGNMIEDKKKQVTQLTEKLINDDKEITIVGGDMNVDKFSQKTLLNGILEDNGLKEFKGGGFTTGTDFTIVSGGAKQLDHFFYKPSERFDINGTIEVVKDMRIDNGYWKPKEERIKYGDKALEVVEDIGEGFEDLGKSIGGLFQSKKQRKKQKKKAKEKKQKEFMSKYRKVFDLSDHFPIKILLRIKEKTK